MLAPFETNLSQLQMLFREHVSFFFEESFPAIQFCLNDFRKFGKDRNGHAGGIMQRESPRANA